MSEWNNEFKHPIDYLLIEGATPFFLLQENDDQIVLEQTGRSDTAWTQQTKN